MNRADFEHKIGAYILSEPRWGITIEPTHDIERSVGLPAGWTVTILDAAASREPIRMRYPYPRIVGYEVTESAMVSIATVGKMFDALYDAMEEGKACVYGVFDDAPSFMAVIRGWISRITTTADSETQIVFDVDLGGRYSEEMLDEPIPDGDYDPQKALLDEILAAIYCDDEC
jgi:hypothetical protein